MAAVAILLSLEETTVVINGTAHQVSQPLFSILPFVMLLALVSLSFCTVSLFFHFLLS